MEAGLRNHTNFRFPPLKGCKESTLDIKRTIWGLVDEEESGLRLGFGVICSNSSCCTGLSTAVDTFLADDFRDFLLSERF